MQQFHIPQFLDVEDTIIGPITVRQFVTMLVGAFFCFVEYKLSDFALFIVLALFTLAGFGLFAFVKVNGVAFHFFLINIIETLRKPKIRTWSRLKWLGEVGLKVEEKPKEQAIIHKPLVSSSQLQELSLLIDTGGQWQPASSKNSYGEQNQQK